MANPTSLDGDHSAALGRDLRGLRKSRGLTLNDLAAKVGRSVGFLSQIERGLSAPSIRDLRTLATAFDVPVSWFFLTDEGDEIEREYIVRAGARRSLGTTEEGIIEQLLSPDLGGAFEMFRSAIEPRTEQVEYVFRAAEEAGYLMSGEIDLYIDDNKFSLKAGDSFRFDHKPCRWHNKGDVQAIIIWVVSPPVY